MNKTLVGIVTLGVGTLGINAFNDSNIPLTQSPSKVIINQENSPIEKSDSNINKILTNSQNSSTSSIVKTNIIPESSPYKEASRKEVKPSYNSNCDPNYSGCVPIASDVDCAGGKGNGPAYVSGPVQVIGNDKYGLDRDHDGWGCE